MLSNATNNVLLQLDITKSKCSKHYYSQVLCKKRVWWRLGVELWHFFWERRHYFLCHFRSLFNISAGVQTKHNIPHSVLWQGRRHCSLSNSLQTLWQRQHGSLLEKNQAHCGNPFCNTQVKPFSSNAMLFFQEFKKAWENGAGL